MHESVLDEVVYYSFILYYLSSLSKKGPRKQKQPTQKALPELAIINVNNLITPI